MCVLRVWGCRGTKPGDREKGSLASLYLFDASASCMQVAIGMNFCKVTHCARCGLLRPGDSLPRLRGVHAGKPPLPRCGLEARGEHWPARIPWTSSVPPPPSKARCFFFRGPPRLGQPGRGVCGLKPLRPERWEPSLRLPKALERVNPSLPLAQLCFPRGLSVCGPDTRGGWRRDGLRNNLSLSLQHPSAFIPRAGCRLYQPFSSSRERKASPPPPPLHAFNNESMLEDSVHERLPCAPPPTVLWCLAFDFGETFWEVAAWSAESWKGPASKG